MEVSGQLHTPDLFTPRERPPGTHWTGGWVGPRVGLKAVKTVLSLRRESNPRTELSKTTSLLSTCRNTKTWTNIKIDHYMDSHEAETGHFLS
jgi:hypothetical protein